MKRISPPEHVTDKRYFHCCVPSDSGPGRRGPGARGSYRSLLFRVINSVLYRSTGRPVTMGASPHYFVIREEIRVINSVLYRSTGRPVTMGASPHYFVIREEIRVLILVSKQSEMDLGIGL
ncbi:hypothetical protein RRG08_044291 [Elysia crispata]|uniref:Uncharacterized protein n=1 Tax=Elysia crispata TaxID=231223 RepID=A0AAE0XXV9_9GAST|nr:hypothetical protein RRG08_044291 [Elysia crispata]